MLSEVLSVIILLQRLTNNILQKMFPRQLHTAVTCQVQQISHQAHKTHSPVTAQTQLKGGSQI